MPLCAYFVSGKCKYRRNCRNRHIDVQYVVQEEMKAAIQGKQWPLSTFSPIFEEPSLLGFLEDYSFEEVRWNFEMAKAENRLPQFQKDFQRITNYAFQKMSQYTMPDETVKSHLIYTYGVNDRKNRRMRSLLSIPATTINSNIAAIKGGTFRNAFSAAIGNQTIFDRIARNATMNPGLFGGFNGNYIGGGGGTSIFGGGSNFGAVNGGITFNPTFDCPETFPSATTSSIFRGGFRNSQS